MRLNFILILILLLAFPNAAHSTWTKPLQPSASREFSSVIATSDNPNRIFVASQNTLFEKETNGSWKALWETTAEKESIYKLLHFKNFEHYLFVITHNSLYTYHLKTLGWTKVFHGLNKSEERILSFAIHPFNDQLWLLGTDRGLFKTQDGAKTWSKIISLGEKPIYEMVFIRNRYLFVQEDRVLLSDDLEDFKKVYSFSSIDSEKIDFEETNETLTNSRPLYTFATDSNKKIWLGTSQGVLVSHNAGEHWSWLPRSGFQDASVKNIVFSNQNEQIYVSTGSGVYFYSEKENYWEHLYEGFYGDKVRDISFLTNPRPALVSITPTEYFEYSLLPPEVSEKNFYDFDLDLARTFHRLIELEPNSIEIQKKVIKYNHVGNGKIKRWQLASRIKSFFPSFSFGKDFSTGNNIDLDRGSTSVPDKYIFGPDEIDEGWDINLGWDFSEAIWSSAQTSIDSRAKLLVDQRRDILSEAMRIYFERRRLQMQIISTPVENEMEHFNQLIRMDELTALLDSLTGGFMSEALATIYLENPEFGRLWVYHTNSHKYETN